MQNNNNGNNLFLDFVDNYDSYDHNTIFYMQLICLISIVLWFIIICYLNLFDNSLFSWFLILIPIFVILINFLGVHQMNYKCEKQLFQGNFLSFGFLITIILINWNNPIHDCNKNSYFKILIFAFVFIMFTLIDFFIKRSYLSLIKLTKSIFNTFALTLLIWALYLYYTYHINFNN